MAFFRNEDNRLNTDQNAHVKFTKNKSILMLHMIDHLEVYKYLAFDCCRAQKLVAL